MAKTSKKSQLYFAWWPNLDANLPIIAAMIGFVYAILLLYPKHGGQQTYHQLQLQNKRLLVQTVINNRINLLEGKANELQQRRPAAAPVNTTDAEQKNTAESIKKWSDSLKAIEQVKSNAVTELHRLNHNNADTGLTYFTRYFSVDRTVFLQAIKAFTKNDTVIQLPVTLYDSCPIISSAPFFYKDVLKIKKQPQQLTEWADSNSSFGLWYVFSIAQMCMWFLIAVLVVGIVRSTNSIEPALSFNLKNAAFFSMLPFTVIILFVWLLYYKLIDGYVIDDSFFMDAFNSSMMCYSIIGYVAALICFSSYLFLSNKLELLNYNAQTSNFTITNNQKLADDYTKLSKAFDNSFLLSAVILSVFVLWMAVLFNGVNNTEVMQFYHKLSGRQLLNPNFVYLIAILHSLLLLIFYVPVRLRFNALEIKQQNANAANAVPGNKKYFSAIWESIGTVLVTASPLIVTVVEKLVSSFLNK
jgi:hypothetical protein